MRNETAMKKAAHLNEIEWKARHRLHRRHAALQAKGKPHTKVVTAIARERCRSLE
jgi:hypothetical protein